MKTKEEIEKVFGSESYYAYKEGYEEGYITSINSLRNQAAIAAMQGLVSVASYTSSNRENEIAKLAVEQADALVKHLKND